MTTRSQPYRLKWPFTPHQVEGTDEMFQILFKAIRALEVQVGDLVVQVANPPVNPGAIAIGSLPFQIHALDVDTASWPSPGDNFQFALTGGFVPYVGAIKSVDLGAFTLTTPTVIGGTAVGSSLSLQSTSGVGTTDHIKFLVGDNGATEAMRILHSGFVGINKAIPTVQLDVVGAIFSTGSVTGASLAGGSANGALLILNNSTADAPITSNIYVTFQTAGSTRWYLGMSPSGATGNFELYDNIGALGLVFSADKISGIITLAKGLVVSAGGITGTLNTAAQPNITSVGTLTSLTSGAITTSSPLIVHTDGAAQRIDIGATGDTASTSQIRFFADSTRTNWQIGNGIQVNSTLTFTPSTAVNGTTFNAPVFQLALTGTTSLQPHSVVNATANLFSLDNSASDAGVTNASYMNYKTAGAIRYYTGISTSAANGDWEIYNNTAGGLAFGVVKATANIAIGHIISKYNAVATTGWGVPAIYGTGRSTAQIAAVASVAAYTVGAADGSFKVSANVNVTTSTLHNFTVTCAYTDETNTARVLTLPFVQLAGTPLTAITNATGAGPYEGIPLHIRCKASTAITIATAGVGGFTTVTYNVEGSITQIA